MRVSGLKQDLNMWRKVRRATGVKPGGSVLRGRTYAPCSAVMEARAESRLAPLAVPALERSPLMENAEGNLISSWKARVSPRCLCFGTHSGDSHTVHSLSL